MLQEHCICIPDLLGNMLEEASHVAVKYWNDFVATLFAGRPRYHFHLSSNNLSNLFYPFMPNECSSLMLEGNWPHNS